MAAGSSRKSQPSPILPPRKINVTKFAEARASELESLHAIVSERLNKDFRSRRNKRRRTTAYDCQASKRRRRGLKSSTGKASGCITDDNQRTVPRRVRRRNELRKNPESGFSTSGDGTKWLRTHVWHAKRFTMTNLWGFHVPLGLHGKGRGSRALLRWFRQGTLIHDASYYSAVQLEGSECSLLALLAMVLEPSVAFNSEDFCRSVLSGLTYGSGMLHSVSEPSPLPIAPVTYLWRRCHVFEKVLDGTCQDDPQNMEQCPQPRQLWLWIHASAFGMGLDTLQHACEKIMDERNIMVKCLSMEGQLGKLEVIGSKALQMLQKTLYPVASNSEEPSTRNFSLTESKTQPMKISRLDVGEQASTSAISSLTVMDPRILPSERPISGSRSDEAEEKDGVLSNDCLKCETTGVSLEGRCLWDAWVKVHPPEEESTICTEKHQRRMNTFCLENPKSDMLQTKDKVERSRSCPILLIKHNNTKFKHSNETSLLLRWTIILPLCWVRVFWNAFVSKGAHAIGLREKHWVSCDIGLPFFPEDFPDCGAYESFMVREAAASDQKAIKRPPALRPFRIPIPSPWNSVHTTFGSGFGGLPAIRDGAEIRKSDIKSSSGGCFDGFVARTSAALRTFLKDIDGNNLPLFPWSLNGNTDFLPLLKDDSIKKQENWVHRINYASKLCFLRVRLSAYKEGSFDEGAVVCAPFLKDISLWTTSAGREQSGLTIPQSSVSSYFCEQSPGRWDINISEDTSTSESHRWPIGFVTTGFIRGSKKPTAEAFCEAVLLAILRGEQWSKMPAVQRKREIYVLVRNLRSSAYRLALAAIVLEEQDHDVESL